MDFRWRIEYRCVCVNLYVIFLTYEDGNEDAGEEATVNGEEGKNPSYWRQIMKRNETLSFDML